MSKRDLKNAKLAHRIIHIGEMCEFLAADLEKEIRDIGGDADAQSIASQLRELAEDADVVSDNILDSL